MQDRFVLDRVDFLKALSFSLQTWHDLVSHMVRPMGAWQLQAILKFSSREQRGSTKSNGQMPATAGSCAQA